MKKATMCNSKPKIFSTKIIYNHKQNPVAATSCYNNSIHSTILPENGGTIYGHKATHKPLNIIFKIFN